MSVVTLIENTQQAKALKLTALSKWISKMNRQNYQLSLITNIVLIALKHCNRVCKTYFHYKNSDKTYCQTYQNF
ncbi:conserved hypothetical protein [Enhydrobacter sp. AX1]|uniref:Uncharacterized protein n=1 Tax=Enhydrobacter aerosaccus TaxID=225324 RepID=A0ABR5ILP6_9HYPH|nr:hypothetical protein AFK20_07280 [Enhydrobacter aerosaccus]VXB29370.1 conserved hypothetical protein [Enhydrobacter sp. AX1]